MSETRALTAALSGPVFDGAASRSAQHASDRHVERWAPEGEGASRSAGMRSLAFADQVASPWMSAASYSRMSRTFAGHATGASSARTVPSVSWLFPRPWYQDELDWMAAARQGLEASPSRGAMTTRGTFMNPSGSESAWAGVAMPVLSADVMASVSPSMSDSSMGSSPMGALRAWSPNVDFAAAAAAEVVAGAMRTVTDAGLPGIAGRSPIWSGLSVVTPHALASSPASSYATTSSASPYASAPSYATTSSATPTYFPTAAAPVATAFPTATSAAPSVESARLSLARIESRLEELRTPTTSSSAADAGVGVGPSASSSESIAPSSVALSAGESNLAGAAQSSSSASGALRTVELLLAAVAARSGASSQAAAQASAAQAAFAQAGSAQADSSSAPAGSGAFASDATASGATAASISYDAAAANNFAPSAGPRVAMPAGLGGLVQALAAGQSVARPMSQVRNVGVGEGFAPSAAVAALSSAAALSGMAAEGVAGASTLAGRAPIAGPSGFSPVWATPAASALSSLSAAPARAIDHLSWSDRWLARFSGASPLAMSAYDSASEAGAPTLRPLSVGSPEVVYVHPQLGTASISALAARSQGIELLADRAGRPAPIAPTPTPARTDGRGALRIDDSEAVPDSVFAAIAAAAAPIRRDAPIGPSPVSASAPSAATPTAPTSTIAPSLFEATGSTAPVDLLGRNRRLSIADLLAVSAPTAPDAGLAPSLASSPMAPALSAVLPLPTAPVFDPRALQGSALTSAYLGGLVARSAAPVGVLTGAPTLAALARAGADAPSSVESSSWMQRDLALAPAALRLASAAPQTSFVMPMRDTRGRSIDPSYVAPSYVAPNYAAQGAAAAAAFASSAAAQGASADAGAAPSTAESSVAATSSVAAPASSRAEIAAAIAAGVPADVIARMVETRGMETELLALRSAMLAAPTSSSVPLAHAAHAPLVTSSVPVPSVATGADPTGFASSSLAPAGGVVHGVASPLAAAQARTSACAFAGAMTLAHPGAAGAVPASHHGASLATAGGRPGSLAEAALAWSVAEERSAASLSFDFVTPEMVLAAKVYGLPPGAAAEAMRMSASGPASMASMATQLDLTLLRAFQSMPAGQSGQMGQMASGPMGQPGAASGYAPAAYGADPVRAAEVARAEVARAEIARAESARAAEVGAPSNFASDPVAAQAQAASAQAAGTQAAGYAAAAAPGYAGMSEMGYAGAMPSLQGASARLPRGAFLWPAGAVAALGLRALSPDGAAGLPIAALELLAAQAVADLGTWVTAFPGLAQGADPALLAAYGMPAYAGAPGAYGGAYAGAMPHIAQGAAGPMSFATPGVAAAGSPGAMSPTGMPWASEAESVEADAVGASTAMAVPATARSRFESVYVALARSTEGQSLSPAARAARAMALLASSTPGMSTRDAAAASWSMLPSVYTGGLDMVSPGVAANDTEFSADARPGLAGLAARAGESIGSFVTPSAAEVATVGRRSDAAATPSASSSAARAAEPVYVETAARADRSSPFSSPRPGRTFTQYGGGEPEIPSWFESAAQRMFASSGDERGGMSLAQMVLVTAMPQQQVAAATRGSGSSGGTSAPGGGGGKQGAVDKPDVDKLAFEVFQEVLHLIDIARQRSGDPFQ